MVLTGLRFIVPPCTCETVAGTQIGLPQFRRSSFIAYQTIRDALFTVDIRLVFKATSLDDGILLYNAYNSSGFGDFIALSIRDQHVVFQFDTGAGLDGFFYIILYFTFVYIISFILVC